MLPRWLRKYLQRVWAQWLWTGDECLPLKSAMASRVKSAGFLSLACFISRFPQCIYDMHPFMNYIHIQFLNQETFLASFFSLLKKDFTSSNSTSMVLDDSLLTAACTCWLDVWTAVVMVDFQTNKDSGDHCVNNHLQTPHLSKERPASLLIHRKIVRNKYMSLHPQILWVLCSFYKFNLWNSCISIPFFPINVAKGTLKIMLGKEQLLVLGICQRVCK